MLHLMSIFEIGMENGSKSNTYIPMFGPVVLEIFDIFINKTLEHEVNINM